MSVLSIGILVYAGVCLALYAGQRRLIYFPRAETAAAAAEVLWLNSGTARLKVWKLGENSGPAILYFGGNAEDVAGNIADFSQWFPGQAIYLVNYRGYGGSSGRPSEAALFADALEVYDALAARHDSVAVIGRSLGTGVATFLAASRPVDRVVLVTPFDSIERLVRRMLPVFPTSWLLRDRFDSLSRAPSIKAPVLAIIAEQDAIIPRPHADALIAALPPGQVAVSVIAHADHNSVHLLPDYARRLQEFLLADSH